MLDARTLSRDNFYVSDSALQIKGGFIIEMKLKFIEWCCEFATAYGLKYIDSNGNKVAIYDHYALVCESDNFVRIRDLMSLLHTNKLAKHNIHSINIVRFDTVEKIVLCMRKCNVRKLRSKDLSYVNVWKLLWLLRDLHNIGIMHGSVNNDRVCIQISNDEEDGKVNFFLNCPWETSCGALQHPLYEGIVRSCLHPLGKNHKEFIADYYALGVTLLIAAYDLEEINVQGINKFFSYIGDFEEYLKQKIELGSFNYILKLLVALKSSSKVEKWLLSLFKILINDDETLIKNAVDYILAGKEEDLIQNILLFEKKLTISEMNNHFPVKLTFKNRSYDSIMSFGLNIFVDGLKKNIDLSLDPDCVFDVLRGNTINSIELSLNNLFSQFNAVRLQYSDAMVLSNNNTKNNLWQNSLLSILGAMILGYKSVICLPGIIFDISAIQNLLLYSDFKTDSILRSKINIAIKSGLIAVFLKNSPNTEIARNLIGSLSIRNDNLGILRDNKSVFMGYLLTNCAFILNNGLCFRDALSDNSICYELSDIIRFIDGKYNGSISSSDIIDKYNNDELGKLLIFLIGKLNIFEIPLLKISPSLESLKWEMEMLMIAVLLLVEKKLHRQLKNSWLIIISSKSLVHKIKPLLMGKIAREKFESIEEQCVQRGDLASILLLISHKSLMDDKFGYEIAKRRLIEAERQISLYKDYLMNAKNPSIEYSESIAARISLWIFLIYIFLFLLHLFFSNLF